MKPLYLLPAALAAVAVGVLAGGADPRAGAVADMAAAASAWLDSLPPEQREKAHFPFEDEERFDWHYIPRDRNGVSLKEMTPAARRKAHDLMRSALSAQGYLKTVQIFALDAELRRIAEAAGRRADHRDPELYWFTVFGEPAAGRPWGWRVEGHHVSLNFTSVTGELGAVTPAFWGTNPHEVRGGPYAGLRVLGREEDLARRLLAGLTPEQREKAILTDRVPRDILLSPGRDEGLETATGLSCDDMGSEAGILLGELVDEYARNFAFWESGDREWNLPDDLEARSFAWIGGTGPGQPHYWRIHGDGWVIEYDNVQDGANHVHTVFRHLRNDFGRDLLREHYQRDHAGDGDR